MNNLVAFNFNGSTLDYALLNGEPLFNLNCVANLLGLINPRTSINTSDSDYVVKLDNSVVGNSYNRNLNNRGELFLTEAGLYRLIGKSEKPIAEKFQKWVNKEVLPSIRKHGMYATPATIEEMLNDPDTMIATLVKLKEERAARIKAEEAKAIAEKKAEDLTEAFSRSIVSDKDKLYSTFIKELKMTTPCASAILKELKIFGKNGHLSDYGDWFKIKVSDNGFPARFVTPIGQMMLVNLFNANRDKMRAIGGTYRYIKPSDRCQIIKLPEDVCKNF